MPRKPINSDGPRPLTPPQEKALRAAGRGGMIYGLPHSTARALRDRSLGEMIIAKSDQPMPNGFRLISPRFPIVTFRLSPEGVREAARLMLAAGNSEGAANVQVASIPAGNK